MPTLIHNVTLATMTKADLGLIPNAALAIENGVISWLGSAENIPLELAQNAQKVNGNGGLLTPGLIDCHTHLVWGGSRAHEFKQRLHGASYADIAAAGGGILSTVTATRAASEHELFEQAKSRADALMAQGVTHIEIKSGYGLSVEHELKQLRVARRLGAELPLCVHTTLLAAHALPPEYKGRTDAYIDLVCNEILPAAAAEKLADAVDVFCENVGFSRAQTEKVFQAAKAHGLPVKLHAEQLSNQNGAALVAQYQGLSADHLEYLSEQGVAAMAQAGTVAVLLPGAFYFLRETQLPPVAQLRAAKVPMAIATDANPGTSPFTHLPLMMHMACTLFRLTPEEAWLGVTAHAAKALGVANSGTLAVGNRADLALWKLNAAEDICYEIGANPLRQRWFAGVAT
ncbi:imidazolonepropionase [Aliidiomarina celeris]|uniref:imidazolonepropionase n=1 Tax=Aliidiomarina celeris TaxID=2249428 RepID=UPI000DE9294B|nr:imidazolonepropionase [Aliidiomarina celeris]